MAETNKILEALEHVASIYPDVDHVFYSFEGQWHYTDNCFKAPEFRPGDGIDTSLLEEAANQAYNDKGHPSAYVLGVEKGEII